MESTSISGTERPSSDDNDYPKRIVDAVESLVKVFPKTTEDTAFATSTSLYGLLLGAAYSLCKSYHRLIRKPAKFRDSTEYITEVRLQLHRYLDEVAAHDNSHEFATELVGLHINAAQHFIHFLVDRLLNVLLQLIFSQSESEKALTYYQFVGMRISLLRWRLATDPHVALHLTKLDDAFTCWSKKYHAGNCNVFFEKLLKNPEVKPRPFLLRSLEDGVRFTLGYEAGGAMGALAYIVDRTNEAKHLPQGAGRAQLALQLRKAEDIQRLYEVEWVISFIAFNEIVDFLKKCLAFLHQQLPPLNPDS